MTTTTACIKEPLPKALRQTDTHTHIHTKSGIHVFGNRNRCGRRSGNDDDNWLIQFEKNPSLPPFTPKTLPSGRPIRDKSFHFNVYANLAFRVIMEPTSSPSANYHSRPGRVLNFAPQVFELYFNNNNNNNIQLYRQPLCDASVSLLSFLFYFPFWQLAGNARGCPVTMSR